MVTRNILVVCVSVCILPVVFPQNNRQYTTNNQRFLEKYFPGKIQLEGRRFDNGVQFSQQERRNGRDSWVGIPSLNLRPYELIESATSTTTPPPTTTTKRPTRATTRQTTKRPTTAVAWAWQTDRPTRSTAWPWAALESTWPTTTPTRATAWPWAIPTEPTTATARSTTTRQTRATTRPTTATMRTTTTTPRQRASLDLDLEAALESDWSFNPYDWTPKVRSLTTRTPITVIATTQTPLTRYASMHTNKLGLKKIKIKKKVQEKKAVAVPTVWPRQTPYTHKKQFNQGEYFLRITPPTRRPLKRETKKKKKSPKKKAPEKKTSSGGHGSPSDPPKTFLNEYTAVTLAPGVDPQNPIVQHLIMTYGDKSSKGTRTRSPKRLKESGVQEAERTLLWIGLVFSWSFWIVVFLTGLKQHHVVPAGPGIEEVHVHHIPIPPPMHPMHPMPPNRALNVNQYENNGFNFNWTTILQTIKLAGEMYEEFDSDSMECQKKAMCELMEGRSESDQKKYSGALDLLDAIQAVQPLTQEHDSPFINEYGEPRSQSQSNAQDCSVLYKSCKFSMKKAIQKYLTL